MNRKNLLIGLVLSCVIILVSSSGVAARMPSAQPSADPLVTDLQGALGSTVGPAGALYVTEGAVGKITRVDPQTGAKSTFAEGLPPAILPIGGAHDLVFIGETAYVLVTMVGADLELIGVPVPDPAVVGIYRVDGPNSFTVIADIGEWSINNPSGSVVFIQSGVQYAIDTFHGAFLVTDGHHNRVLRVTRAGEISEFMQFGNIVPTGLDTRGNTVYMAQAGPNPHAPDDGKVVAFGPMTSNATEVAEVASGEPMLVDVEFGRGSKLYALSQGDFPAGGNDGDPALPDSGALVEVNGDGSLTVITEGLDRPTSVEFIGNTAYVVSLAGEILKIDDVSEPPFGVPD